MSAASTDGNNVFPITGVTPARCVIAHGNDSAVRFQPYRMSAASTYGDNIRPIADVTLARCVIAHGNDSAVRLQTHCMSAASTDGNNVYPVGDVALTVIIAAYGNDRTGGSHSRCKIITRADGRLTMPGYGFTRGGELGKVRIARFLRLLLTRSVYCLWNREAQRQNRKQRRRDDEQALLGQRRLLRLFILLRRFDGLCRFLRGSLFLQLNCRFRGLWSFFLLFLLLYRIFILIGSRRFRRLWRLCGLRGTRLLLSPKAFGKLGH